jgi:hypothetical protein
MIAHHKIVEMPRREAAIAGSVEAFDLRLIVRRHPFGRRAAQAAVEQPDLAVVLVAAAPAAERPLADPQQLAYLDLIEIAPS